MIVDRDPPVHIVRARGRRQASVRGLRRPPWRSTSASRASRRSSRGSPASTHLLPARCSSRWTATTPLAAWRYARSSRQLIAELKRLYVVPAARNGGLGVRLTEAALDAARTAGYARVRLDTLSSMQAALRLYERLGFRDIDAYRYNPIEAARYLDLKL